MSAYRKRFLRNVFSDDPSDIGRHLLVDEVGQKPMKRTHTMYTPIDPEMFNEVPPSKRMRYWLPTPDYYGDMRLPNPAKIVIVPAKIIGTDTNTLTSLLTRQSLETAQSLIKAVDSLVRYSVSNAAVKRNPDDSVAEEQIKDAFKTRFSTPAQSETRTVESGETLPIHPKKAADAEPAENAGVVSASVREDSKSTPENINVPNQDPPTVRTTSGKGFHLTPAPSFL